MNNKNPMFNSSGCKDLTSYEAIKHINKEQHDLEKKVHNVVTTIKNIIDLAGFEIIGRIQIKDKRTGKEFR